MKQICEKWKIYSFPVYFVCFYKIQKSKTLKFAKEKHCVI